LVEESEINKDESIKDLKLNSINDKRTIDKLTSQVQELVFTNNSNKLYIKELLAEIERYKNKVKRLKTTNDNLVNLLGQSDEKLIKKVFDDYISSEEAYNNPKPTNKELITNEYKKKEGTLSNKRLRQVLQSMNRIYYYNTYKDIIIFTLKYLIL
jgi:hypothetical protein